MSSLLVVLDHQGLIVLANDAWKHFGHTNGLSPAYEWIGKNYLQVCQAIQTGDSQAAAQGLERVLTGETTEYLQVYPCHGPEQPSWFQLRVTRIPHAPFLLVIHEDVTQLKAVEHALEQQVDSMRRLAEQSRQVLENMLEAWFLVDQDWRFLHLNSQAEALLQRPAAELLGQKLWEAFPEAVATASDAQYHAALREQRPVQFEQFYAPLNTCFQVRAFPTSSGLTVYFHDVNAKKREEQAQRDRNVILEMTVQGESLPDILHQVAVMVERQHPGYVCTLLLDEGGRLYTAAAPSLPLDFRQAIDGLDIREGAGVCGTAAFRSEMVVVEDPAADTTGAEVLPLLFAYGLRAGVALPIIDGQKIVLGTLALYSAAPGPFGTEILDDLGKAQHLAAVAIEHDLLSKRLLYQTRHDALTGLANRVLFEERLHACVKAAQEADTSAALLFIDVDDFKAVNDSLGHHVGDEVLRVLAARLQDCVRLGDTLARISGDEFTVILPHSTETSASETAQRCLRTFDLPFYSGGREIYITASIGISVMPIGGRDAETLQRNADLAMYHAKSRKSGWAVFEPSLNRQAYERFQLAAYLRRATELNELELHFQPQITLAVLRGDSGATE